jgi:hypothetical protein
MQIGDHIATDVVVSISEVSDVLLLGKDFLAKFESWKIDNQQNVLILIDK